jgi:hypothetical protein
VRTCDRTGGGSVTGSLEEGIPMKAKFLGGGNVAGHAIRDFASTVGAAIMLSLAHLLVLVVIYGTAAEESATADVYDYKYAGQPFQVNTLAGATNISVEFSSPTLLAPSTTYDLSLSGIATTQFASLTISDGINTISPGDGTFLDSDFITTNSFGSISRWQIVELSGSGRSFAIGQCCTINDPPFMYTYCCNAPTDASIWTNGFFGIGPKIDYAYNNCLPGVWTASVAGVPELSVWAMLLIGFAGFAGLALHGAEAVKREVQRK